MAEEITSEEKTTYVRYPFSDRKISDLNSNMSVAVTGMVVSKDSEIISFIIEDGSDRINVITNNMNSFNDLKEGQLVRVLGKTWGDGQDLELKADIIQDFSGVDFTLYKKLVL